MEKKEENRHAIPSLEKKNEESHKQELFICFTRKKRKTTKVKTIPDLDNRKENAKLRCHQEIEDEKIELEFSAFPGLISSRFHG